jgi:transcription termination/antitermination protein NusG
MPHIRQDKNDTYSGPLYRLDAPYARAVAPVSTAIAEPGPMVPTSEQRQHSSESPWFALRVKPNHEKSVAAILREKRFEEFLPLFRSRRRWSDRIKAVDLPLFPGYLFCRLNLNLDNRMPLLTTPGLLYIVGRGRTPEPVNEGEILDIRLISLSGLPYAPWPSLIIGQKVRLEAGPLCGLEGVLTRIGNQHKIYVSVTLLQRSVSVEVDSDWIRVVDRARAIPAA